MGRMAKAPVSLTCAPMASLHTSLKWVTTAVCLTGYPSHEAIDFYHHYEEDMFSSRRWASRPSAPPSTGPAFSPPAWETEPNEKGLEF